jgi:hypothetical protein
MTRDDVIRTALEVGAYPSSNPDKWDILEISDRSLERFAKLVAAHEREACAKICDDWPNGRDDVYSIGVAIRARGEK